MTSRLVAPGVPRELIDDILSQQAPGEQNSEPATVPKPTAASIHSLLSSANAWSPPAAYGGLPERAGQKAAKSTPKFKPGTSGAASLVSAENFMQFTQLPFQPTDAPQRVATAAKFRLDRKLRYAVGARSPPCLGAVAIADVEDNLRAVALNCDATSFLVATDDGTYLWNAATQQSTSLMESEHRMWNELFFGALPQAQTQLYQAPGASVVQISQQTPPAPLTGIGSMANQQPFRPLNLRGVLAASFAPDSPLLLTTGIHGQVTLTATDSLLNLVSFSGHSSRVPVWSVDWSPAGSYFATGAGDGTARLWRTDIVAPLRNFAPANPTDGRHVQNVAWHPNSHVLATANESEIVLWDVLASSPIHTFKRTNTNDIAFSPNGNFLAIASDQGLEVVEVLEAKTILTDESEVVMNVAWSWPTIPPTADKPAGASNLVSVGHDGKCKLYDKLATAQTAAVCELPLERPIRPFKAQFTWKNFLVVAGADASEKLALV